MEAPGWTTGAVQLSLQEGASREVDDALIELYADFPWGELQLEVTRGLPPMEHWSIRARDYVGVARLPTREGIRPQVEITPKLANTDIHFLADYAYGADGVRNRIQPHKLNATVAALRRSPAASLIDWFLSDIERFVSRHLRRDYVVQRDVFEGRIRGRLLVGEYATRYLATGRGHFAPSQFFDFTVDNLPNQILKAALRELARATALLHVREARQHLRLRISRILPYLGTVTDQPIYLADFNRLRLRGALRHYDPLMRRCRALFQGRYTTATLGQHKHDAFIWYMPGLFQDALKGILRTTPGITIDSEPAKVTVKRADEVKALETSIRPDYVLKIGDTRYLLDAKYKDTGIASHDVLSVDVPDAGKIAIRLGDIYQAISYGQHTAFAPASVGLVYPVVLKQGQSLPPPYTIHGFVSTVDVLFIDVGEFAHENVSALRQHLLERPNPS